MLSLENGQVQCWSDHPAGGYKGSFQSIHTAGDYVSAFATDLKNDYLFTGTTVGYVKVWLMTNYLTVDTVSPNVHTAKCIGGMTCGSNSPRALLDKNN